MADPVASTLKLPANLDFNAAADLTARLRACRGRDLEIDASAVERIGGLCLQTLLSARLTWARDHARLAVTEASAVFRNSLALYAVDLSKTG